MYKYHHEPEIFNIVWKPEGAHNTLAEPAMSITLNDWLAGVFLGAYGPSEMIYKGMVRLNGRQYTTIYVVCHGCVLALCSRYIPPYHIGNKDFAMDEGETVIKPEKGNIYAVRCYRIGCLHPNKYEVTHRMFDHEQICPDCGWKWRYDSSG
jgi:hypothetical protein